jgi:O-antigen/teichoic acid export membrane protein
VGNLNSALSTDKFAHLKPMSIQKQTLWSLAPLLVATALNLFSVPRFYDYLGPEMYALWFYVLTFTGAFGFMDLGLGVAVGRYIGIALSRQDQAAVRQYWGTGHGIALPLLLIMAVGFAFVGCWFGPGWFAVLEGRKALLQWCFIAGGAGLFLSYYSQQWMILAQAHLDFAFLSKLRILVTVLTIVPSIYIAFLTANPLWLIIWNAVISACQALWLIFHAHSKYRLGFERSHFSRTRLEEMGRFTAKVFLELLTGAFYGSIDRIFLGKWALPALFTHYNIASNVGARLSGLSVAVMGPVFHNTSRAVGRDARHEAALVYNSTFNFVFGWFCLAAVWAFAWDKIFLYLWLGPSVASHVQPVFAPLVAAYTLVSIGNISGAQLAPLNRVGTGIVIRSCMALLTVFAVWLGWKYYGIAGAAWGFLFSRAGCLAQDFYVIRLIQGEGWLSRKTWKQLVLQICIGLAAMEIQFLLKPDIWTQSFLAAIHALGVAWYLLQLNHRERTTNST